jgi:hypothetical protein
VVEDVCLAGIHSSLIEVFLNSVLYEVPELSLLSPVHGHGIISIEDTDLPVPNVLFDTGALSASYASSSFIMAHHSLFEPYLRPYSGSVRLADNKTVAHIDKVVRLPISFTDSIGHIHSSIVPFCVLPSATSDLIIGLPHIIRNFGSLLVDMLTVAMDKLNVVSFLSPPPYIAIDVFAAPPIASPDLAYPWTSEFTLEAPEDAATPLPCSFSDALHYMEMSVEESRKEYLDLFDTHICADFVKAEPRIIDLLNTLGMDVFVPTNWTGIHGLEPLELQWKPDLPDRMKPPARFVNPRLLDNCRKELDRLRTYMYVDSDSPIASPMVVAPKATKPFIRICGDYVNVNRFVLIFHFPIPHIIHELARISRFTVFVDFDMSNSFHQVPLGPITSANLSIQTPWGQFQPLFMPEGVGPASGVLQRLVSEIFSDFQDWCITIFDNFLILAHDYADAYVKVERFLSRCKERNVFLKFSKSWVGFDHANFFGYVCRSGSYELSSERKAGITAIPFPDTCKKMQSFLGAALFFKSFIPHFSSLTALLNDMTKDGFDWDRKTWTVDYDAAFSTLKDALGNASSLHYPDYDLPWILRVDASQYGVGAALYMLKQIGDSQTLLPIAFAAEKFSEQASRWTTIEREAYSCYFGPYKFSYYLHCKEFILETDHNNLLWMEKSTVPKIIRWRIFLQSFKFHIRHIKGKDNVMADYLSRLHEGTLSTLTLDAEQYQSVLNVVMPQDIPQDLDILNSSGTASLMALDAADLKHKSPEDVLKLVHGGRNGHLGARLTYLTLNKVFPGHMIPYAVVREYVATCPICQKFRLGLTDNIVPIVRHLKPEHQRAVVGVDTLTITPEDKYGNKYCTVVVNHFTKFCQLYPMKSKEAVDVAACLFNFFCTFGVVEAIYSDPGSEYMSEVVQNLAKWFGIEWTFSLVDRHESNGVEGTNKQILRHLSALVNDERICKEWSSPTVLPIITFLLNSTDSSETGVIPFHSMFGTSDATYHKMPKASSPAERTYAYVTLLDQNLRTLQDISKAYQDELIAKRTADTPEHLQNLYQKGDYVLLQLDPNAPKPTKLSARFRGPYEVLEQYKNDVKVKDIITGAILTLHVSRLKIFHGTPAQARDAALLDNDQYEIECINAYRGDPDERTTMEFEVQFMDGSLHWLPWTNDITTTVHFEDYCRSKPALYHLLFTAVIAKRFKSDLNRSAITSVKPGVSAFVDLRSYGFQWYQKLALPDLDHLDYVVEYKYGDWSSDKHTKISARCAVFDENYSRLDHLFVYRYGSSLEFQPSHMVLIDPSFVLKHPNVLPDAKRARLLARYQHSQQP